jgi:hypothetical protein
MRHAPLLGGPDYSEIAEINEKSDNVSKIYYPGTVEPQGLEHEQMQRLRSRAPKPRLRTYEARLMDSQPRLILNREGHVIDVKYGAHPDVKFNHDPPGSGTPYEVHQMADSSLQTSFRPEDLPRELEQGPTYADPFLACSRTASQSHQHATV